MTIRDMAALPMAPQGLVEALDRYGAGILRVTDHAPRYHVRLSSPSGPLFGWYTTTTQGQEVLRRELETRERIGHDGLLRAPATLAHGADWRVEQLIASDPIAGPEAVSLAVRAGLEIAHLPLPGQARHGSEATRRMRQVGRRVERALRLGVSPLPVRDWLQARRLVQESPLARVTSHGSYQPAHLFLNGGVAYVIDWEELAARPLGWDLMQLWASLPDAEDRTAVFALAVDALGTGARDALRRLRYAALVARIVSKVAEDPQFGDRDSEAARELLALLPAVRWPAGGRP